jgi:hypothetical protein
VGLKEVNHHDIIDFAVIPDLCLATTSWLYDLIYQYIMEMYKEIRGNCGSYINQHRQQNRRHENYPGKISDNQLQIFCDISIAVVI